MPSSKGATESDAISWASSPSTLPFAKQAHYRYQEFPADGQYIRLLYVHGSNEGSLSGVLEQHEVENVPDYCALSYEWGRPGDCVEISIDDCPFTIQRNLSDFLRSLMPEIDGVTLFVDAICIDQSNVSERNAQVARMGSIYQDAKYVFCWLGGEADRSADVIKLLKASYYGASTKQLAEKALAIDNSPPETWISHALRCLIRRPYFLRLWIVQEIILAKELILFCGADDFRWPCFDMDTLSYVLCIFLEIPDWTLNRAHTRQGNLQTFKTIVVMDGDLEADSVMEDWSIHDELRGGRVGLLNRFRTEHASGTRIKSYLPEVLEYFGYSRCSDQRDRVYGLLGIVDRLPDQGPFPVDYGQDAIGLLYDILADEREAGGGRHLFGIDALDIGLAQKLSDMLNLRRHVLTGPHGRLDSVVSSIIASKAENFQSSGLVALDIIGRLSSEISPIGMVNEAHGKSVVSVWSMTRVRTRHRRQLDHGPLLCYTLEKARPSDLALVIRETRIGLIYREDHRSSNFMGCRHFLVGRCVFSSRATEQTLVNRFLERRLEFCSNLSTKPLVIKPTLYSGDPWAKPRILTPISATDLFILATNFQPQLHNEPTGLDRMPQFLIMDGRPIESPIYKLEKLSYRIKVRLTNIKEGLWY